MASRRERLRQKASQVKESVAGTISDTAEKAKEAVQSRGNSSTDVELLYSEENDKWFVVDGNTPVGDSSGYDSQEEATQAARAYVQQNQSQEQPESVETDDGQEIQTRQGRSSSGGLSKLLSGSGTDQESARIERMKEEARKEATQEARQEFAQEYREELREQYREEEKERLKREYNVGEQEDQGGVGGLLGGQSGETQGGGPMLPGFGDSGQDQGGPSVPFGGEPEQDSGGQPVVPGMGSSDEGNEPMNPLMGGSATDDNGPRVPIFGPPEDDNDDGPQFPF
jgi:hypothetical protein